MLEAVTGLLFAAFVLFAYLTLCGLGELRHRVDELEQRYGELHQELFPNGRREKTETMK